MRILRTSRIIVTSDPESGGWRYDSEPDPLECGPVRLDDDALLTILRYCQENRLEVFFPRNPGA